MNCLKYDVVITYFSRKWMVLHHFVAQYRAETVVPKRLTRIEKAILERDFNIFGLLTMQVCAEQDKDLLSYRPYICV